MLTLLVGVAIGAVFVAMLLGTAGVHNEASPPPRERPYGKIKGDKIYPPDGAR